MHTQEDQCEWHRMTTMTRPNCAVMCTLIYIYTHTHMTKVIIRKNWNDTEKISLAPGERMTRINREMYRRCFTHTHPWEDQLEWHRMTRMTRPYCAVMCNLINTHTHTHTHTHTKWRGCHLDARLRRRQAIWRKVHKKYRVHTSQVTYRSNVWPSCPSV